MPTKVTKSAAVEVAKPKRYVTLAKGTDGVWRVSREQLSANVPDAEAELERATRYPENRRIVEVTDLD